MSETQKLFASLSGAVAAHMLLLLLVFFLIGTRDIGASLTARGGADARPNEVTILLGELMERVELESPAREEATPEEAPPPEDPLPPALPAARPFIDTDLNAPEAVAPENARFESDRNTRAASELPPEAAKAAEAELDLPTTRGNLPLPHFSLQNRRFLDGEFDRPPAPETLGAEANPAAFPASPAERPGDPADLLQGEASPGDDGEGGQARPRRETAEADGPGRPGSVAERGEAEKSDRAEDSAQADSAEPVEGVDTPPALETAETLRRPEGRPGEGREEEPSRERSYLLPEGNESPMAAAEGREAADAFAAARPDETEAERGEATDLPMREEASAETPGDGREREEASDAPAGREAAGGPVAADSGLFAPGFSPERIQNSTAGTLSNRGQNAVDAEATPAGRYKKAVQQAIARKWHQYRHQHAEYVSWGVLKLECRVDSRGKVHGLRVVDNQANAIIADFSLRAILDAELPPMPPEVAEELGVGGLHLKYDIIIY